MYEWPLFRLPMNLTTSALGKAGKGGEWTPETTASAPGGDRRMHLLPNAQI